MANTKQEGRLKYAQINDVFHGVKTELTEINKPVIGRALLGGVLLGGVGAVAGAVGGTGKKCIYSKEDYLQEAKRWPVNNIKLN